MNLGTRLVLGALIAVLSLIAGPPWQDAYAGEVFPITPCRAVNTASAGGAIGGSSGFSVVGNLNGQGGQATCGVPSGAQAVFLTVTVVKPSASGSLILYPWPGPAPVANTLSYVRGVTLSTGALVTICNSSATACASDLVVAMSAGAANVIIDITGYVGGGGSPPPPPVTVGWFKVMVPYQWHQSNGPMPFQIQAMIDDGTPQIQFVGTVTLGMMALGQIAALYDTNMNRLPSTQTTTFAGGLWNGYVMLQTSTGQTQDLGLRAQDPVSGVAGTSNPVTWMVP